LRELTLDIEDALVPLTAHQRRHQQILRQETPVIVINKILGDNAIDFYIEQQKQPIQPNELSVKLRMKFQSTLMQDRFQSNRLGASGRESFSKMHLLGYKVGSPKTKEEQVMAENPPRGLWQHYSRTKDLPRSSIPSPWKVLLTIVKESAEKKKRWIELTQICKSRDKGNRNSPKEK
jgi:hypothetical protein